MTRGLKPATIVVGTSSVTIVPSPPAYLSKDAKAEWRKVAPVLVERGVLTVADMAALANYCIAVGMMVRLDRKLRIDGDVLPSGKRNPASTALMQAMQQMLRAAGELGLTPAARSRASMIADNDDDEDNPLMIGRNRR